MDPSLEPDEIAQFAPPAVVPPARVTDPVIAQLTGLPLSPSENDLYIRRSFETYGGGRAGPGMRKSEVYEKYIADVDEWAYRNMAKLKVQRMKVHGALFRDCVAFHVHVHFYMLRERILTKTGTPKRNDTANRFKALFDQVARLLMIDDRVFWAGSYDKTPVDKPSQQGADLFIAPHRDGF